jgi:hypothetical protein
MTRFTARPTGKPIDFKEAHLRVMIRYPKTMAILGDYDLMSIRQLFNSYVEPNPEWAKDLLAKLK